jgi:hypothetical protein
MQKLKIVSLCTGLLISSSAFAAEAQVLETYVSKSGLDTGNCASATSPCLTLTYALSQTATKGQINILNGGVYNESLTVSQHVRIASLNGDAVILAPSGDPGITFNGGSTDKLNLFHVSISGNAGGTNGITVNGGAQLGFFHADIFGFSGIGIDFTPNNGGGTPMQLDVEDAVVRNNTTGNILIMPSGATGATAVLKRVSAVATNGYALDADSTASSTGVDVAISDSLFSWTVAAGIVANAASAGVATTITVERTVITNSSSNCVNSKGTGAFISLNASTISNCLTGLHTLNGGALISFGNNGLYFNNTNGSFTSTLSLN